MDKAGCVLIILLAGCSTGGGGFTGGDGGPTGGDGAADLAISAAQACTDYFAAFCPKINECDPFVETALFGDVAACLARLPAHCADGLATFGSLGTPGAQEACAKAIGAAKCDDLFQGKLPAACVIAPGAIANGNPCNDHSQCQSTFCGKSNGPCGTCGPPAVAGVSCANINCATGYTCSGAKLCVAYALSGDACDEYPGSAPGSHPCLPGASCKGAGKTKMGTCQPSLALAAACDPNQQTTPNCDGLRGYFCNSVSKACDQVTIAHAGDPCGFFAQTGKVGACVAGGHCKTAQGQFSGTCMAAAADGAPCDLGNGPDCLFPAKCTGGICKFDSSAMCK